VTDYTVGDTLYLMFTTRAFATGIPTVLAGTPVVSAYENDSATQITAGITLGVSHDSVAGMNLLTIVATGANGYESGKDYNMVITTGTVDSVSVIGEVVGTFSLGRSAAAADLANGTDGLGALKTLIDTVDDLLDTEIAAITAAVITNAAGADIAADIIAIKSETAAIVNDTDLIDDGTSGLAKIATDVAAVLVDTAVIGAAGAGLTDLGGMSTGMRAEVNAEVDTALNTAVPGAPTSNSINQRIVAIDDLTQSGGGGDLAAILTDTAEIGTAGAGLTDLGGMSTTMKGQVNTEADTALTDYDGPTNAEMVARTITADQIDQLGQNLDVCARGTASGTPTTTTMVSDVSIVADTQLNGRLITFGKNTTTSALRKQTTDITSGDAATNTLTFTELTTAPVSGDTFVLT